MQPATTTTLHVRRARLADLPFLQQDGNIPSHEVRRKIELGDVFVADHGVEPVAYLRVEYLPANTPLIASVFVLDTFRRRGIGRELVGHAGAAMRARGFRIMYASVPIDASVGIAWLRRLHFDECGFLAGPPGEPGLLFFRRPLYH